MNTKLKYLMAIVTVAFSLNEALASDVQKKVYMFGLGATFSDSTVYITDIQEVGAWVSNDKKHFLAGRDQYSYQLKNFLTRQKRVQNPTCVTFYALKRSDLEKKLAKVRKRYTQQPKKKKKRDGEKMEQNQQGFYNILPLGADEFMYEAVTSDVALQEQKAKEAEKAAKEKKKKEMKKGQGGPGGPGGQPPMGGTPPQGGMGGGR